MKSLIGLLLTLTFIYPATRIIKLIVEEKERRIKESMKIMGLKEHTIWFAWLTLYGIIFGIIAALITLITAATVFEFSNKLLIFIVFYEFAMCVYSFCFLISVFFTRSKIASTVGGLLLIALLAPTFAVSASTSSSALIGYSFSPVTCFSLTMYLIFQLESTSIGAHWNNVWLKFLGYSIGEGMWLLLVDFLLYLTIAIYLSYVLPSTYGVPRKWYFLCQPSFWRGSSKRRSQSEVKQTEEEDILHQKHFEECATDAKVGVAIRHLRKEFPNTNTVAVNDLSLNMYNGEIFALLGHNGAGKTTTISMLTGMFPPTSGDAQLGDKWITTDMHAIRSEIGYCPQHDVLFDDLTVHQHLIFYGNVKKMNKKDIPNAVNEIIHEVGLEDKVHAQSKTLSGGQKRKLSVAIALLGESKVVFLDEPTSGMDVFYRRHMWDLLKKKEKRSSYCSYYTFYG